MTFSINKIKLISLSLIAVVAVLAIASTSFAQDYKIKNDSSADLDFYSKDVKSGDISNLPSPIKPGETKQFSISTSWGKGSGTIKYVRDNATRHLVTLDYMRILLFDRLSIDGGGHIDKENNTFVVTNE